MRSRRGVRGSWPGWLGEDKVMGQTRAWHLGGGTRRVKATMGSEPGVSKAHEGAPVPGGCKSRRWESPGLQRKAWVSDQGLHMAPSTVQPCLLPSEAWTAVQGKAGTAPNPSRAPSALPYSSSPDLYKGPIRKDQMQEEQKSRNSTL